MFLVNRPCRIRPLAVAVLRNALVLCVLDQASCAQIMRDEKPLITLDLCILQHALCIGEVCDTLTSSPLRMAASEQLLYFQFKFGCLVTSLSHSVNNSFLRVTNHWLTTIVSSTSYSS
ncbi:hypothetical protein VNO78_19836 [Psophocarpus tetragonolobus]|uniref:Secreted protein n=1 Tax=Psophocarpus tetragonolobus TaxID=3891 RepID=A0AAN9XGL6_PSOTE